MNTRQKDALGEPDHLRALSNALLLQQYSATPAEVLKQFAVEKVASTFPRADTVPALPLAVPLRVGFVSSDLCDHPVGLLLLPLLLFTDRARITPICYSTGGRQDATRSALRQYSVWRDVEDLDDEALVLRLRQDQLHVVVDLSGHTAGNRLAVFARRVAPLQVSWLGYFATTAIPAMDTVLMDSWHVPPEHENHFTERVLRLPSIRWCYHPVAFAPPVAPPPLSENGYVTFGSFNNTRKYNPRVINVWARILGRLPGSRLVLKWNSFSSESFARQIRAAFAARGIGPERLELRSASFHRKLLEEYSDIDIALDPFPFTGGYTSCESLWMGLPIVTLRGDRAVGRQTFALINAIGVKRWIEEWIASDEEDYVEKAVALGSQPKLLAEIRGGLRAAMKGSPLMNARQFAKDFEEVIARELRCVAAGWA